MIETKQSIATVRTLQELYQKLNQQDEEYMTSKTLSCVFAEVLRPKEYERYQQKKNGEEPCHARTFRQLSEFCLGRGEKVWAIEKKSGINGYTCLAKKLITFKTECELFCERLCDDEYKSLIVTEIRKEFDLSAIISSILAIEKINEAIEVICDGDGLLDKLRFPSKEMLKVKNYLLTGNILPVSSSDEEFFPEDSFSSEEHSSLEENFSEEAISSKEIKTTNNTSVSIGTSLWKKVKSYLFAENVSSMSSFGEEFFPEEETISSKEGTATNKRSVFINDGLWNGEVSSTTDRVNKAENQESTPSPRMDIYITGLFNNTLSLLTSSRVRKSDNKPLIDKVEESREATVVTFPQEKPVAMFHTLTGNKQDAALSAQRNFSEEEKKVIQDIEVESMDIEEDVNRCAQRNDIKRDGIDRGIGVGLIDTEEPITTNNKQDAVRVQRNFSEEEEKVVQDVEVELMDIEEDMSRFEETHGDSTGTSYSHTNPHTPTEYSEEDPMEEFMVVYRSEQRKIENTLNRPFSREIKRVANTDMPTEGKRLVIEIPDDDSSNPASIGKQKIQKEKVKLPPLIVVKQEIPTFLGAAPFNKAQQYLKDLYSLLSVHKALFNADQVQFEKKNEYLEAIKITLDNIAQAVDIVKDMKETKRPIEMYRLLTRHMYIALVQLIQYQKKILPESKQKGLRTLEKALIRDKKEFFNWKLKTEQGDLAVKSDVELYGEILSKRIHEFFGLKFWKQYGFSLN